MITTPRIDREHQARTIAVRRAMCVGEGFTPAVREGDLLEVYHWPDGRREVRAPAQKPRMYGPGVLERVLLKVRGL